MVLVAYRHGLRAVGLRWDQVDFRWPSASCAPAQEGQSVQAPIAGRRDAGAFASSGEMGSDFVFLSERGAPFSEAGFAKMVERAGVEAGLGLKVHPHMLRHASATSWRTTVTIPDCCKPIWATRTSTTQCDTLSCRRKRWLCTNTPTTKRSSCHEISFRKSGPKCSTRSSRSIGFLMAYIWGFEFGATLGTVTGDRRNE